jgi:hypothetical protein
MKIKNFALIIGAMKAGTSSLFKYLSQHPEISPCRLKEPLFFSDKRLYAKGFNYYQNLWNWNPDAHKIALESTVQYTRVTHPNPHYGNAAENIAQFQASTHTDFKFIYIMRNPLDRIESHYTNGRAHLHEDTAKSLAEEINSEVIDTSRYAMQLKEYYNRFPSENILLLDLENLKKNPFELLKKICRFLEINSNYKFQELNINHNSYVSKIQRVAIPGYSRIRKTELMKILISQISDETRCRLKILRNLFTKTYDVEYIKLSPEQKIFITQELQEDLKILKYNYGFDISSWNINI